MTDRGNRGGRGGGGYRGGRGGNRGGAGGSGSGAGGGQGGGGGGAQGGDRGERPKKENILDLKKYMDQRITVKFNGGREGTSYIRVLSTSFSTKQATALFVVVCPSADTRPLLVFDTQQLPVHSRVTMRL